MVVHARFLVVARRIVTILEGRDVAEDDFGALLLGLLGVLVPGDAERPGGIIDGDQALPLLYGDRDRVVEPEPLCLEL